VVVTWTGDFDFQIRKPGVGGTEYHWHLAGTASADNRMIFHGCTFTSDYTTGLTQVVYQQVGKSHEFRNCTMVGVYDCLVTVGSSGKCNTSVIDGLTISGSTNSIVHGNTPTDLFGSFDHRRIAGNVTKTPYINGDQVSGASVTTSGLLTTSQMWGMDGATTARFGTGTIAVEKCVFSGSRAYGFGCSGNLSTGTTFRDCEFCGFSGEAVNVILSPLANLIDYCGASNGCPALSNSAGSVGTHCLTSDPLFVDYAGHDYHLLAGSPRIDAGTACIATVDPDGNAIPLGAGVDIGPYEYPAAPPSAGVRLVSAAILDAVKTIVVTADETVTQGGTGGLAHWSQILHSAFGDSIVLTDANVQGGAGMSISLTYTGNPTPGARYLITTDSAEFETGYKTVYAVMAIGTQDFTPEPLLPSLLSGIGKQLAYTVGHPQTVLTTALAPTDTEAFVESTLGFPDTDGVIYIAGTRLEYAAKTSYSFTGLVWPTVTIPGSPVNYATNFDVFQIDTPVLDYSHKYSLQDAATNERIISRCYGNQLRRLVSSLGFTPPLATMVDADIQAYANERMYQDTGTWQSIFRTLRPVLRELEPNGTAAVAAGPILNEVLITDVLQAQSLVGRWMEVNGKIARISSVTAGTGANCYDISFYDYDGLMWEDPDLASQIGDTVNWRLLLFTMYCDLSTMTDFPPEPGSTQNVQAGKWVVNLYIGGQTALNLPVGYWCADSTFDMNGEDPLRPRHNYLAASHATIAVVNDRFLYLIDNYDYEVTALTGELVPAAVIPIVEVL